MVTRTEQLKALAEAAMPATDGGVLIIAWHAYCIEATPQVIKALCELVEQLGGAIHWQKNSPEKADYYIDEALATFERFQKGE